MQLVLDSWLAKRTNSTAVTALLPQGLFGAGVGPTQHQHQHRDVFAVVPSTASALFRPRGVPNCAHQRLFSPGIAPTLCISLLVGAPLCASSTVVACHCLLDSSAQGLLPLFKSACFRCCNSWWNDWAQAGLVTGWLGDGRFGHIVGVAASGTVVCATNRWLAQHARVQSFHTRVFTCTVLSILLQLVFADERSLASLHCCVFGTGGSEMARGATLDECAGSGDECVCSAVFHAMG